MFPVSMNSLTGMQNEQAFRKHCRQRSRENTLYIFRFETLFSIFGDWCGVLWPIILCCDKLITQLFFLLSRIFQPKPAAHPMTTEVSYKHCFPVSYPSTHHNFLQSLFTLHHHTFPKSSLLGPLHVHMPSINMTYDV